MTPARILVVEDNPLNLKLVRDVLTFANYDVIEAQSGEEALRAAKETPPDLVLMDLQLGGGMDCHHADGVLQLSDVRTHRDDFTTTDFAGRR